jgi:hypothetical protein
MWAVTRPLAISMPLPTMAPSLVVPYGLNFWQALVGMLLIDAIPMHSAGFTLGWVAAPAPESVNKSTTLVV